MNKKIKVVLWILSLQIIGIFIGFLTKENISSWYVHLNKSPINPPQIAFPITWSFLYVTIAIAGFLLFEFESKKRIFLPKLFFSIQLIMNWLWTPIFFSMHKIELGFYWIIFIIFFTLMTIIFSFQKCKSASIILLPYFLWLIFAAYLNYFILAHN